MDYLEEQKANWITMHETYKQILSGGFSKSEALRLIAIFILEKS